MSDLHLLFSLGIVGLMVSYFNRRGTSDILNVGKAAYRKMGGLFQARHARRARKDAELLERLQEALMKQIKERHELEMKNNG